MNNREFNMNKSVCAVCFSVLVVFLLVVRAEVAPAARENSSGSPAGQIQYEELGKSLQKTLTLENEKVEQLKHQFNRAQQFARAVEAEINAFKIQISAYSNLLLLPSTRVEDLEKARPALLSTMDTIAERLKELSQKRDGITQMQQQIEEQLALNEKQLAEIKVTGSREPAAATLLQQLQSLTQVLSSKREILQKTEEIYSKQLGQMKEAQQSFLAVSKKFDERVQELEKQVLFDRNGSPITELGWGQVQGELKQLAEQLGSLLSIEFWLRQGRNIWKSGGVLLFAALLLFGIIQALLVKLQHFCVYLKQKSFSLQHPWRCLTMDLFQRSLPLLGTVVFLYTYAMVRQLYTTIPFIGTAVQVLLIWLYCRWWLDFLKLWKRARGPLISPQVTFRLRTLLNAVRFFAIAYVVLEGMLDSRSTILALARILFEIILIIWSVPFWKHFREGSAESFLVQSPLLSQVRNHITGLGYIIAGGGLLLELAGYGQLALLWYASWGRTLVVALWGCLLFLALREWDQETVAPSFPEQKDTREFGHHIRWLVIKICWLGWLGTLAVSLLLAWGASRPIIVGFFRVLNYPIPVGGMRFSLLGIVYAFLILIFTLAATRLWRQVLRKKILVHSGLELGLQESISTISAYLFWTFGILAALNALGLSTTSLAVAFGALGIGLGFGLQNIFNNFISGLILLFERPIQVGDVVEVGGTWGTVTKINVRSTVVQTYDNASLIIPNSEFISSQLTNWSFKDRRLRRSVTVGVAYGSDVELVRQTLLEIAESHPNVLKVPKSDVLFVDFGDSSLVFKLRVWTSIQDCLATETEIRFAIDRLFKERNIEIPFPQRDIHIRSVEGKFQAEVKQEERG